MEKCSASGLVRIAKRLSSERKRWHFHMLGKGCRFNESKGKYCIVLEEEGAGRFFSLHSAKPIEKSKSLARLLYGKDFLKGKMECGHSAAFGAILERAAELEGMGADWHHHHLPPGCVFNVKKGKHCILLEDKGTELVAVFRAKPKAELAKIEKLFYG